MSAVRGENCSAWKTSREGNKVMSSNNTLSYVNPTADSPWGTYLSQVDRVIPYLGKLARWLSRAARQ